MRIVVASTDDTIRSWLRGVLGAAGLSVAVIPEPSPGAPELVGADLLIADKAAAAAIGSAGPARRQLVVPRGAVVDVAAALAAGFADILVVPAPEEDILRRVGGTLDSVLRRRRPAPVPAARVEELRSVVARVVEALGRVGPDARMSAQRLAEGMLSVFMLLIDAHETMERLAPGHSKRVARLARAMADAAGMSPQHAAWLELAARLQDIGHIPLQLPLGDAAPLAPDVRRTLGTHPKLSGQILEPLEALGLQVAAIRAHHERVDGSGYPAALAGDGVPLAAQILGAADAYEALTSARPWRPSCEPLGALDSMRTMGCFREDVLELLESVVDVPHSVAVGS